MILDEDRAFILMCTQTISFISPYFFFSSCFICAPNNTQLKMRQTHKKRCCIESLWNCRKKRESKSKTLLKEYKTLYCLRWMEHRKCFKIRAKPLSWCLFTNKSCTSLGCVHKKWVEKSTTTHTLSGDYHKNVLRATSCAQRNLKPENGVKGFLCKCLASPKLIKKIVASVKMLHIWNYRYYTANKLNDETQLISVHAHLAHITPQHKCWRALETSLLIMTSVMNYGKYYMSFCSFYSLARFMACFRPFSPTF